MSDLQLGPRPGPDLNIVHAASLALHAGIAQIVVPPASGVFSAFGLLFARIEHRLVRTCAMDADRVDLPRIAALLTELGRDASELMAAEGVASGESDIANQLDIRYRGQSSEIAMTLALPLSAQGVADAVEAFHLEHERTYGYASRGETVQLVNLRLRIRSRDAGAAQVDADSVLPAVPPRRQGQAGTRHVYFGDSRTWHDTPVVRRSRLVPSTGPLIIEEYDTTIVIPPGAKVRLDETGSVRIDLSALL